MGDGPRKDDTFDGRSIRSIDLSNTEGVYYLELKREQGSYIAQHDSFNCVPATLLNVAQAMGYELVSGDGRSFDVHSIRRALHWPEEPEFVDNNSVLPILNALPKVIEGQQNAFQHQAAVMKQGVPLTYPVLSTITDLVVNKKMGIMVGFGDHESVWVPIINNRYVHVDSLLNPVKSAPQSKDQFVQALINGAPHSSPNGEYPIFFNMTTARMAVLSR